MTGFKSAKKERTFYFIEVINIATFKKHGKGWKMRVSWYDSNRKHHFTLSSTLNLNHI